MILAGALASLFVSLAVLVLVLKSANHWALDVPNDRSLHSDPVPRSGGLAIMAAVAVATTIAAIRFERVPLAAAGLAFLLCGISLADDRHGLPIRLRLATHLLAAGLFAAWLTDSAAPWWWMLAAMLGITAMTNFFNFMDGANGLAGGMAVAGFGTYAVAAAGTAPGLATLCAGIAAAAAGFLVFNLRGRIFMGDGGSVPLGFLAAVLGLEGWTRALWPLWFPALVFAPFIVDAVATLARRILRGERFWEAHREHYYQRLVRSGWSHERLAVGEYILMVACAAAALIARSGDAALRIAVFATIGVLLGCVAVAVDLRWRRHMAFLDAPR